MELLELSFTHFWNGYPQEQTQEEVAAVALVSPPGWERHYSRTCKLSNNSLQTP